MKKYYYLAFVPVQEGFAIFSPDFEAVTTQGENLAQCMEMGEDALRIVAENYAQLGKKMPAPSSLEEAQKKIAQLLESLALPVPQNIQYQLFPLPETDQTPVRISATFTRYVLDILDEKARKRGMTRSGFLADLALNA